MKYKINRLIAISLILFTLIILANVRVSADKPRYIILDPQNGEEKIKLFNKKEYKTPQKDGYIFEGWKSEDIKIKGILDREKLFKLLEDEINSDELYFEDNIKILKGSWKEKDHKFNSIILDANMGEFRDKVSVLEYQKGMEEPKLKDFKFYGYTNEDIKNKTYTKEDLKENLLPEIIDEKDFKNGNIYYAVWLGEEKKDILKDYITIYTNGGRFLKENIIAKNIYENNKNELRDVNKLDSNLLGFSKLNENLNIEEQKIYSLEDIINLNIEHNQGVEFVAIWENKENSGIILDGNGGVIYENISKIKVEDTSKLENLTPQMKDAKFTGWTLDKDAKNKVYEDTDISIPEVVRYKYLENNKTYYALWTARDYKENMDSFIYLNANGGEFDNLEGIKAYEIKVEDKSAYKVPYKEGFKFIGWSDNMHDIKAKFTEEEILSQVSKDKNTSKVYYAVWQLSYNDLNIEEEKIDLGKYRKEDLLNLEDHNAYLKGYEDKKIRPENYITRQEVAQVIYRLLNNNFKEEIKTNKNNFRDVDSNLWSNEAISSLENANIIKGYPDNRFYPNNKITRAEVINIISKFEEIIDSNSSFKDIDSHWAEREIKSAYERGYISGYNDEVFKPDQNITRAEFVKIINKLLNRSVRQENIPAGIKRFKDLSFTKWYYKDFVEATTSHKIKDIRLQDGSEIWIEIVE